MEKSTVQQPDWKNYNSRRRTRGFVLVLDGLKQTSKDQTQS